MLKLMARCCVLFTVLSAGAAATYAAPAGADGSGAGEPAAAAKRAVTFSGCVQPFRSVTHRVNLPRGGRFLHRVTPDRGGFNVVMTINYPGLRRPVNQNGPGRAESFTVNTPFQAVRGTVKMSGVRGSFGCYVLRVTP